MKDKKTKQQDTSLEIIDKGADHTDNVQKEYELSKIPTVRYTVKVGAEDKNKNWTPKTVTIKKIEILRNKDGIIIGHLGSF